MKKITLTLAFVISMFIVPCFAAICTTTWATAQYAINLDYVNAYTDCATFECETAATDAFNNASFANDLTWAACCVIAPIPC